MEACFQGEFLLQPELHSIFTPAPATETKEALPGPAGTKSIAAEKKRISNREAAKRHREKKRRELQLLEGAAAALRAENEAMTARLAAEFGVTAQPPAAARPAATGSSTGTDAYSDHETAAHRGTKRKAGDAHPESEGGGEDANQRRRRLSAAAAKKFRDKRRDYMRTLESDVAALKGLNGQLKDMLSKEELKRFVEGNLTFYSSIL